MKTRIGGVLIGVLVLSIGSPQPAAAHNFGANSYYGWSDCSFTDLLDYGYNVEVGWQSLYPFPGDVYNDGVWNSFYGRLFDAVYRWDHFVRGHTTGGLRDVGQNNSADIRVSYRDVPGGAAGSNAWVVSGGYSCGPHGLTDRTIFYSDVWVDPYDHWFSQDDSRRSYWEGCPSRGYLPTYTCSKKNDVGSLITHELGHGLGFYHPQTIDVHRGENSPSIRANCASASDPATLCSGLPAYRTAARTIHVWDLDTLTYHFQENNY